MSEALIEALGFVAGALGALASAPQIIKIIRTGDARDVSRTSYLVMLCAAALWVGYGALRGLVPVMLWNAVWFATSAAVLVLKLRAKTS